MKRGNTGEPLGGKASPGGANAKYLVCGDCTPDLLDEEGIVYFRVRLVGIPMKTAHEQTVSVDVLECPECGHQILR